MNDATGASMSQPDNRIFLGFALEVSGQGDFFTLNDATKGLLNNATFKLASDDVLVDVSTDVRSIRARRGRSRELEKFNAGSLDVVLSNAQRKYDPTNTAGPYYPDILPRKQVTFTSNGQSVFTGIVDDWNFSYEIVGDATAQVIGTDGFSILSLTNIEPYSAPQEGSGARISAVLSRPEVNWPLTKRAISAGNATVAAQDIGGTGPTARATPTLNYLQQVELAESGLLFINKDGFVQFDARVASQDVPSIKFADDLTGIPYTDVRIEYGTEEMKNRVAVYRINSNTKLEASNPNSISRYGPFDYEITDSLLATDEAAEDFAVYVVAKYANPALRIDQIAVVLNDLDISQVNQVLGLELGDTAEIVFTPEGIGSPITQVVAIDSIEHNVTAWSHVVTFNFSEAAIGFILDDPNYGLLNTSKLGF